MVKGCNLVINDLAGIMLGEIEIQDLFVGIGAGRAHSGGALKSECEGSPGIQNPRHFFPRIGPIF